MSAPARTALELQEELASRLGRRVLLCLTDNRRRMLSVRKFADGQVEIRLQRFFLESPPEVLDEIVTLVAGGSSAKTALRAFTNDRFEKDPGLARPSRPPSESRSDSRHHDIGAYAERLNRTYLGGRSTARVVWGRRNRSRGTRSIRFGCYDPERNLVILNRKLDQADIPSYFVEFVIFHELLHEVLGIGRRADGKRDIHSGLFKLMESTYPDYEKALRFEKELCRRLASL